jgi:glycosyltransferase involved in cell wall biosynthesis
MLIGIEASHANKTPRTGVEWYGYHLIQELKKIIPASVRVILYSDKSLRDGLENLPPNWQVKILRWPARKGWSQARLAAELWLHPPDVFFAPGQLVPCHCPANTVATIHDSAFMADKKSYWWASRWYLQLMNRLILRLAKKVLVSADFDKYELLKFYQIQNADEKIKVIPLAYDTEKYPVSASPDVFERIFKKYQLSGSYILSVARLEEKKNTKRLVAAFNIIKSNNQITRDLKLVLVGKPGVGYDEVKVAIDQSPYRSDIITLGYTEAGDLAVLMARARVFAFVSLYEGFGIPVLEAMASGVPVVAANNTALPEVGGVAGLYVDPYNVDAIAQAITRLITDTTEHSRQVKLGLERASEFSWAKTAARTWQELNSSFGD